MTAGAAGVTKVSHALCAPGLYQTTNQKYTNIRYIFKSKKNRKVKKYRSTKVQKYKSDMLWFPEYNSENKGISDHQQIYIYSRHRSVRKPRQDHQSWCTKALEEAKCKVQQNLKKTKNNPKTLINTSNGY